MYWGQGDSGCFAKRSGSPPERSSSKRKTEPPNISRLAYNFDHSGSSGCASAWSHLRGALARARACTWLHARLCIGTRVSIANGKQSQQDTHIIDVLTHTHGYFTKSRRTKNLQGCRVET